MAKMTLAKTIEARKLNPRTRIPTTEPPATIPYGAIITEVEQVGDADHFMYLGTWHQCAHGVLQAAVEQALAAGAETAPKAAPGDAPAPAPASKLQWEMLASNWGEVRRAKVPGGWLVAVRASLTFYPDPEHAWDGSSV